MCSQPWKHSLGLVLAGNLNHSLVAEIQTSSNVVRIASRIFKVVCVLVALLTSLVECYRSYFATIMGFRFAS